jgi:hypothetical protein
MSSPPIQALDSQVQPLDLFPSRLEELLMKNQEDTSPPNNTPRIDVSNLQPAELVTNINPIATTGPLRRTISIVPSTPEDWDNRIYLDLSHQSNADLVGRHKTKVTTPTARSAAHHG